MLQLVALANGLNSVGQVGPEVPERQAGWHVVRLLGPSPTASTEGPREIQALQQAVGARPLQGIEVQSPKQIEY